MPMPPRRRTTIRASYSSCTTCGRDERLPKARARFHRPCVRIIDDFTRLCPGRSENASYEMVVTYWEDGDLRPYPGLPQAVGGE